MYARRRGPPDRLSLAGSIAVHSVAGLVAVWSTVSVAPEIEFITYEIELVSPLPAAQAEEIRPATEELVVERPDPTPPPPEVPEDAVIVEDPEPADEPEEARPDPPETAEEASRAAAPDGESEAEESGQGLNVRMEGLRRDYPAYYDNIIRQIQRCFRWRGEGRWATVLYFEILRDGTVEELRVLESSGNMIFDIEAQGAVECAGRGRFGPLPEELPYDRFPIRFSIDPRGGERPEAAEADPEYGGER